MAPKFVLPSKLYQPLNRCAYCPSTETLSTEHIIALGLGGKLILPKASCEECRKATSKVEDFVLRKYLCPLRSYLSLPSRNPFKRPGAYKLKLQRGGRSWTQNVDISAHPGVIRFVMFATPPGRVEGLPREQSQFSVRFVEAKIFADWEGRLARLQAESAEDNVIMNAMDIARMMAKTALSFAIAELGHEAFEETYINHLIRGATPDWNYWVGGYPQKKENMSSDLHDLKFLRRGSELSAIVHLFVPYCPNDAYEVVVGRLRPGFELPEGLSLL